MRISFIIGVAAMALGSAANAQEYCRAAPVLAQLPPEPGQQQSQLGYGAPVIPAGYSTSPEEQICPDGTIIPIDEECPPPPPPPPPPPAEPGYDSGEDGSIVVTGTRARGDAAESPSAVRVVSEEAYASDGGTVMHEPPGRRPQPYPRAGLLTAGDHDDLLNPELYAFYVRNAQQELGDRIKTLPVLDTRRAVTVELKDRRGRPVAMAPVIVTCSDGNSLEFTTQADGRVVLFPALDRLSDRVRIEAGGEGRPVLIGGGDQLQSFSQRDAAQAVRKMDLMIALDATGSMGDEIAFLKAELKGIVQSLQARHQALDLRIGLVAYRDEGDEFVTRTYDLTGDMDKLQADLARQRGNGGGDMPEAMDQAMMRALDQDWRDDAIKSMLLVADAPPHDDKMATAFAVARAAREKRIHITPVASSGVDDRAEYFMRSAAAMTQSRYVFLTDDSGIGNPHAEPEVACYVVTSLASAIRRVLDAQLSGRRIEPKDADIIRTNGQYDQGKCSLPSGFAVD